MMLLRPAAFPDEFAIGYAGRFMKMNALSDEKIAFQMLREWGGNPSASSREVPKIELLAKVAELETARFVRDHTAIALQCAFSATQLCVPHGSCDRPGLLWSVALRSLRPGAYFCTKCVHEDIEFHGMSYWRREHQLPGLYWCQKHDAPLAIVRMKHAFRLAPSAYLSSHEKLDAQWVDKLRQCPRVLNFLLVCDDLIARTLPLPERAVARVVTLRARSLGLHTGRGEARQTLVSDFLSDRFDLAWLRSVIPSFQRKIDDQHCSSIDRAVLGKKVGATSLVYAVIIAALFENVEDALNSVIEAAMYAPTPAKLGSARPEVCDDAIRLAYVRCGGSHRAVASELQISSYNAGKRLNKLALPTLGIAGRKSGLKDAASDFIVNGKSLGEVVKIHGVSQVDLESLLRRSAAPLGAALLDMNGGATRGRCTSRPKPAAPPLAQHQCNQDSDNLATSQSPRRSISRRVTVQRNTVN